MARSEKMGNAEWSLIRSEYVKTDATQRELAEKYGVSINTLKKISARERWRSMRHSGDKNEACTADEILTTGKHLHGIINKIISQMTENAEADGADSIDAGKVQKLAATLKILKEMAGDGADDDMQNGHMELIGVIKEALSEK